MSTSQNIGPPVIWYSEVLVDGRAHIFVPTTERLLVLNEAATQVWQLCDGSRTHEDLVREIAARHGMSPALVSTQVSDTVELLVGAGLLHRPVVRGSGTA